MRIWVRAVTTAAMLSLAGATTGLAQETRTPAQWPFAANSPWNMSIGSGALYEDPECDSLVRSESTKSGELVRSESAKHDQLQRHMPWINAERYSFPLYSATDADPEKAVYKSDDGPRASPFPLGTLVDRFRVPDAATPAEGTDRSMVVVQPDGHRARSATRSPSRCRSR